PLGCPRQTDSRSPLRALSSDRVSDRDRPPARRLHFGAGPSRARSRPPGSPRRTRTLSRTAPRALRLDVRTRSRVAKAMGSPRRGSILTCLSRRRNETEARRISSSRRQGAYSVEQSGILCEREKWSRRPRTEVADRLRRAERTQSPAALGVESVRRAV